MFVIDRDQLEIVSLLIRSLTAHSLRSLESQRTQRLLFSFCRPLNGKRKVFFLCALRVCGETIF